MEYEPDVGEDDDCFFSPGTKTAAALVNIFPINPTSQQVTNENAAAVVIENAKLARTMPQVHPKLTDYDNDNTNTDNQTGSSGVLIASGSTLLLTRCTRTSDNNHRLKSPHYPQQNPPPPNHHHQSSSPSLSSPGNIIMEESTTVRSIVCNRSNFQRETSPRGNFGMSSRTTTRKTGGTWSSWLPHYHQPNLASVFVLILVVISLSVNTCLASNYSGSSGHNNYTSSRSNYLAETRNNNNNQQQQTSDKLGKENVFKDLTTVEDINGLLQLEESELDGSRQDYKEDNGLGEGDQEHYTHQWAVHILGGPEVAARVAEKHGFHFHGEILQDYYHLTHSRVAKRSIEPHTHYHTRLASEPEVRWLKQQTVKRRVKRDFLPEADKLSQPQTAAVSAVRPGISIGQKSGRSRAARRSKSIVLNDPRWPAMWYLNRGGGLDMNVLEAWNEGITGKGIVVTILDDGLEKDHPDIVRNYDPMASFDVNSLDTDPMPTYDLTDSNRHGTRCAGEVAAEANNSICAVGIAYEAGVGGVRMLDGDVTDAVEARSLSHNPQHIDIYSASWGPDDDGKTVDGPGELATRAFMEGVTKGRNGKGSIFVWASGNGGRDHDNCNCDGYTNSIWTLSISSATENGLVPWYSEACSSTLATTYSSGGTGEKQIVTIDLHHSCTSSHTGTSASAPLAAGICALALHANNNLTWRDMQHIVVRTARPQHLIANDWATNGVGRNVSHSFGYGLMDAGAMVKLAKKWKTVPQQHKCEIKAPYTDKNIPSKSKVTLDLKVTNCPNVNYLEHVQAKVTLTSGRRGDLQIFLISPAGTKSQLLAHRRHDLNRAGFTDWPFMTVHSWGESPVGKWTLEIHNEGRYAGKLQTWSLIAHGITSNPNDQAGGSATGEGESTGSTGVGEKTMPPGSSAVVDATNTNNFDGSDNTLDSTLQANGDALPSHAGIAKPVSIVGRPSAPAQQEASSSSADCVKLSAQGQCLECVPGLALLHSDCVSRCPDTFYVESQGTSSLQSQEDSSPSSYNLHYFCRPCHYSCQTCSGPGDDECISCYSDAKLHRISTTDPGSQVTDKAHCYPLDLMNTLDRSDLSHRILLAVVGLAIVFILIMLSLLCCTRASSSQNIKKGDNPFKKHWEQPYKRINPEEEDDGEYDDEEDDEYQYYPASSTSGASTSSGRGGLKRHSNQTHLELISEDEEEDFEHVTSVGGGTSIRTGQEIEAPPKVPLLLHSYSRQQDTNESSNSAAEKGPLV